ncbi:MAG TPA: MFS transporter, partial [Megamonas hypermegale]|nr:MFS transporter [Megamonas hypermegale]
YGAYTPFWAIPPSYLSGSAVAAGIALINSVGNLGGFFGPYILGALSSSTGSYTTGIFALAGFMVISSLIVIFVIKQTGKVVNS